MKFESVMMIILLVSSVHFMWKDKL